MNSYKWILVSLLVLVPSSSFFIVPTLIKEINLAETWSDEKRLFAVKLGIPEAIELQLKKEQYGSEVWLELATTLAKNKPQVNYKLAQYFQDKGEQTSYLFWLKQGVEQGHSQSIIEYAQKLYKAQNFSTVISLISQASLENIELSTLLFKSYLGRGNPELTQHIIEKLDESNMGRHLIQDVSTYHIERYYAHHNISAQAQSLPTTQQCQKKMTLVGTTYDDLKQLTVLKQSFNQSAFSQFICVQEVMYFPIDTLQCTYEKAKPIMCNEAIWKNHNQYIDSDYIGVMLPEGKANVHLGILYFDRFDSFEVFSHEVSHLLGFADEYRLSKTHQICQLPLGAKALNISLLKSKYEKNSVNSSKARMQLRKELLSQVSWGHLVKESTPILIDKGHYWQLGTPEANSGQVGLFLSETCELSRHDAYKPLKGVTSLRYTNGPFPSIFMQLAEQNNRFSMPHYYFNIATALYRAENNEEGQRWLSKAHQQ